VRPPSPAASLGHCGAGAGNPIELLGSEDEDDDDDEVAHPPLGNKRPKTGGAHPSLLDTHEFSSVGRVELCTMRGGASAPASGRASAPASGRLSRERLDDTTRGFFDGHADEGEKVQAAYNLFNEAAQPELVAILKNFPEYFGKEPASGKREWLLKGLRHFVSAAPPTMTSRLFALVGHYAKPLASFLEAQGCYEMLALSEDGNSFLNPSIGLLCEILASATGNDDKSFHDKAAWFREHCIGYDFCPYQLYYDAHWDKIVKKLSPSTRALLRKFHYVLRNATRAVLSKVGWPEASINAIPTLSLGSLPFAELNNGEYMKPIGGAAAPVRRILHTCCLIDRLKACGFNRHDESDAATTVVLTTALGRPITCTFFTDYFKKNKVAIMKVLNYHKICSAAGGRSSYENGSGIHARAPEQHSADSTLGGEASRDRGSGIHARTSEQHRADGTLGGDAIRVAHETPEADRSVKQTRIVKKQTDGRAAGGKTISEKWRVQREANEANPKRQAALAVASPIAPFRVGQAVRKINTTKNTKKGKTRIVSRVLLGGWIELSDGDRMQKTKYFMLDV